MNRVLLYNPVFVKSAPLKTKYYIITVLSVKHWQKADSVCIPCSPWMHHGSDLHPPCSRLILILVSGLWAVRCSWQIKPINLCKCEYLCLPSELSAAPGLVQTLWDLSLGAKSAGIPSAWWGRGSDWLAQDQVCLQDEPVIPGTKRRRGENERERIRTRTSS